MKMTTDMVDVVAMMKTATSKSQRMYAITTLPSTVHFVLSESVSPIMNLSPSHSSVLNLSLSCPTFTCVTTICFILSTKLTYRTMQCLMNNVWLVQKFIR